MALTLGRIQNWLEEMEEMRVHLNQQEGLIADLSACLVRVERRTRRMHERERESCSLSSVSSYGSFCGQELSGEDSAEDPIMEREVIIHMLVPEENKEPVLVPEPSLSHRSLVERIGGRLVEWNLDEDCGYSSFSYFGRMEHGEDREGNGSSSVV